MKVIHIVSISKQLKTALAALAVFSLVGCASTMSGLSGSTQFACKAPDGVACQSISGTYANVKAGNYPSAMPQNEAESGNANGASKSLSSIFSSQKPVVDPRTTTVNPRYLESRYVPSPAPVDAMRREVPLNPALKAAPFTATPLRVRERVLRVWFAPIENAEGDLLDQRYVYVAIAPGAWNVDTFKEQVRSKYTNTISLGKKEREEPPKLNPVSAANEVFRQFVAPEQEAPNAANSSLAPANPMLRQ